MIPHVWFIVGAVFLGLELLLPGGMAGALGLSTLMIGVLVYIGWLTSYPVAFAVWLALSALGIFIARKFVRKFVRSQSTVGNASEDDSMRGLVVPVLERIDPGGSGRVVIRGASWLAVLSDKNASVEIGTAVRLISRDNIVWTVEPVLEYS